METKIIQTEDNLIPKSMAFTEAISESELIGKGGASKFETLYKRSIQELFKLKNDLRTSSQRERDLYNKMSSFKRQLISTQKDLQEANENSSKMNSPYNSNIISNIESTPILQKKDEIVMIADIERFRSLSSDLSNSLHMSQIETQDLEKNYGQLKEKYDKLRSKEKAGITQVHELQKLNEQLTIKIMELREKEDNYDATGLSEDIIDSFYESPKLSGITLPHKNLGQEQQGLSEQSRQHLSKIFLSYLQ